MHDLLERWARGVLTQDYASKAVLSLILAYAAQARSANIADAQRARYYYNHGRQIALLQLTDEPRLETVQAFLLICLYMPARAQRNGAFLNLGIAISAAKSLGFHRDEMNADSPEGKSYLRYTISMSKLLNSKS